MRYSEPIFSKRLGMQIKQVSRIAARKAYENGEAVYLLPANVSVDNGWVSFCPISKEKERWSGQNFETSINEYTFYNCCSELGRYPIYFIETK